MSYLTQFQDSTSGELKARVRMALRDWSRNQIMAAVAGAELAYAVNWATNEILRNGDRYVSLICEYVTLDVGADVDDETLAAMIAQYLPVFAARLAPAEPVEELP
jgi:hypothetical protein